MDELRRREERLRAARRLARLELLIGFASPFFAGFLWMATPGFMVDPWQSQSWIVRHTPTALAVVGILGFVFGLAWMVRIYRGDPEPSERYWRFRRF